MKANALFLGLVISGSIFAEPPFDPVNHWVTLSGIPQGEGRLIRVDEVQNNKYKIGGYFCAESHFPVYYVSYYSNETNKPLRIEHDIKFSICQDETLTNCQEFGNDHYVTTRDAEGHMKNDATSANVDVSGFINEYQSCDLDPFFDITDLAKKTFLR